MILEESMDLMEALAECVVPAPMAIDATKFSGNGSTYACLVPAAGETLRLLDMVLGTQPPFDPSTLRDEAHVTLVYSREQQVDLDRFRRDYMTNMDLKPVTATVDHVEYWEGHDKDGYAVFKLQSPGAAGLNGVLIACGAKHSFDNYQAHMTIHGKVGPKTAEVEAWIDRINAFLKSTSVEICFDRINFEDIKGD